MQNLPEHPDKNFQISLLASCYCQGNKFAVIDPEEISYVTMDCRNNNRHNIVTCWDESVEDDIRALHGLDLDSVNLNGLSTELPVYIPIVPRELFESPSSVIKEEIVGVLLKDVINYLEYKKINT